MPASSFVASSGSSRSWAPISIMRCLRALSRDARPRCYTISRSQTTGARPETTRVQDQVPRTLKFRTGHDPENGSNWRARCAQRPASSGGFSYAALPPPARLVRATIIKSVWAETPTAEQAPPPRAGSLSDEAERGVNGLATALFRPAPVDSRFSLPRRHPAGPMGRRSCCVLGCDGCSQLRLSHLCRRPRPAPGPLAGR